MKQSGPELRKPMGDDKWYHKASDVKTKEKQNREEDRQIDGTTLKEANKRN